MRIYTKVVWQWVGESLVRVEEQSYEYTGPVALAKGGGGGSPYYGSLERLYNAQAGSAEYLNSIFKGDIGPAYQRYLQSSEGSGSQANQEAAATRAMATGQEAMTGQEQALSSNLMSMGIDPSDERYQTMLGKQRIAGAGVMAGQATAERSRVANEGSERLKGAIGLGMGVPQAASQAAGQGVNAAQIGLNAYNQQQAQQGQAVGNIARAATNYAGDKNTGGFADGGPVLKLENGGYVHKMAGGGFLTQPTIQPPPPMGPTRAQSNPAGAAIGGISTGVGVPQTVGMATRGAGMAIQKGGELAGSPYAQQFGQGLEWGAGGEKGHALLDTALKAGESAKNEMARQAATRAVDGQLGTTATQPAAELASDTVAAAPVETAAELGANTSAATTVAPVAEAAAPAAEIITETAAPVAAEGLAGLGAGSAVAAGIGTAMPWIGAGLAAYTIGSEMGWWKDGGPVGQQQGLNPGNSAGPGQIGPYDNGASGGEVDGPGGPKDDKIHAMLSDGEYVMPRGAVLMFGLKHLDGMRQKGLDYEKQMGIH